jgi:hypothetical protein
MEEEVEVRYSMSRSPSPAPERKRSRSPEGRKSPERVLPFTPLATAATVIMKMDIMEVETEMNDTEFMSLKNSEKRSYNKRMRERHLLAEKHLLSLTQELLGQV